MLVEGTTNSFFRPDIMRTVRFRIRLLNISSWSSTVKTLRGCRQAGNPDIWHVDCTKPGMIIGKTNGGRSFGGSHTASRDWSTHKRHEGRVFFLYGNWRYDDFDVKIPFLSYYLHLFPYQALYPGCFEWSTLKNIFTSMELRFWNQAAVVSTAEIFTLSACTTAGTGGAT